MNDWRLIGAYLTLLAMTILSVWWDELKRSNPHE